MILNFMGITEYYNLNQNSFNISQVQLENMLENKVRPPSCYKKFRVRINCNLSLRDVLALSKHGMSLAAFQFG